MSSETMPERIYVDFIDKYATTMRIDGGDTEYILATAHEAKVQELDAKVNRIRGIATQTIKRLKKERDSANAECDRLEIMVQALKEPTDDPETK